MDWNQMERIIKFGQVGQLTHLLPYNSLHGELSEIKRVSGTTWLTHKFEGFKRFPQEMKV